MNFKKIADTSFKGQNSMSYFGSVIWNSTPAELKERHSFQVFKSEMKALRPTLRQKHCGIVPF